MRIVSKVIETKVILLIQIFWICWNSHLFDFIKYFSRHTNDFIHLRWFTQLLFVKRIYIWCIWSQSTWPNFSFSWINSKPKREYLTLDFFRVKTLQLSSLIIRLTSPQNPLISKSNKSRNTLFSSAFVVRYKFIFISVSILSHTSPKSFPHSNPLPSSIHTSNSFWKAALFWNRTRRTWIPFRSHTI